MLLGAILDSFGSHPAAWLTASGDRNYATDLRHYAQLAKLAEEAAFDFIFFADSPGISDGPLDQLTRSPKNLNLLEPLTLLAALTPLTRRIGLVATASTSYNEPFNVARLFASLDHMSGGRAGWNAVTTASTSASMNFGLDGAAMHADRYARAEEFVDVVAGLWDSWADNALINDLEAARYADPARIHPIDHRGRFFSVKGPLNMARTPQGRPVITQAGGSDAGRELAARTADMVFTVETSLDSAVRSYGTLRAKMVRHGRDPATIRVVHGVTVVVGDGTLADAKIAALSELIHEDFGRAMIANVVGFDLSQVGWNDVIPAGLFAADSNKQKAYFQAVRHMAVDQLWTLREISCQFAQSRVGNLVKGTPGQIVDELESWIGRGACDGFIIRSLAFPDSLAEFCAEVVPELRKRGHRPPDYLGDTLRDHLGLDRPAYVHV